MAFSVTNKQLLYEWAMDLMNTPYIWGGQEAIDGESKFDCSGFIVEGLRRFGVVTPTWDSNAQGIYTRFASTEVMGAAQLGDLVFYGSSKTNIGHVMMALNDSMCIGAQGGGSGTKTVADAVSGDGYVRLMPIKYRSDRVAIVRPAWPKTMGEVISG